MKIYVETTLLLAMAKDEELAQKIDLKNAFISDLVLAEIHNLEEPWRNWVAKFLKEHPLVSVKLQKEEIEFARKYVYNKIIKPEEFTLGLHYFIGCSKGFDAIYTCDPLLEQLKPEMDRINLHFNKNTTEVKNFSCTDYPQADLIKIRQMINRLCESQGEVRLLTAIRESQEFFCKEKELSIKRLEKLC
ncbi:hypothetical protein TST_0413 [Thermosulfidibacter takaii ABI70S6]|uniref:PIN domain-containing protein n=1 Tax=Thermosulfidibacter takaii (strain DSM 17441 / JCM 13301 / NBRC 103674 / ABI70S6) TaxID=1298851 RepID=A0A0S3QSB9_THET7|nr:hypothetical protein [Thermosulfidibacter takaii]BAT71221.1 hypothetical protein TST_0413 [Thermosulfidibacter takaii ABI70S6]